MRKAKGFYTDEDKTVHPITSKHPHVKPLKTSISSLRIPKRMVSKKRLREVHKQRSIHAQRTDEALAAPLTRNAKKWSKQPNRLDIQGIDFFPAPTYPGNAEVNVKTLAYTAEQYYDVDTSDLRIKLYSDEKAYDEAYGTRDASSRAYAFAVGKTVAFSPKATKVITRGKMESRSDFVGMKAVSHEIGHIIGNTKPYTSKAFDEGSNELLATRFTLNTLQMKPELRKELRETLPYSYYLETRYAGNIALLVNDGDEDKAIAWIKRFRSKNTPKAQKKEMRDKAERKLMLMAYTTQSETSKTEKEIDVLRGRADARWAEVKRLRKQRDPMYYKLRWHNQERGVLSVATAMPLESELKKYPEKRKLAEKYRKLKRRETIAITEAHIAQNNARSKEARLHKQSVFLREKITIDDVAKTKKILSLHYPEAYERTVSWKSGKMAWWVY